MSGQIAGVVDLTGVKQMVGHLHEPRIELVVMLCERPLAPPLGLQIAEQGFVMQVRAFEDRCKILDYVVRVASTLLAPAGVEPAQLFRRQPVLQLRGELPNQRHAQFVGRARADQQAGGFSHALTPSHSEGEATPTRRY